MKYDFGKITFSLDRDGEKITIEFSAESTFDEVVEKLASFSKAIGYSEKTINMYLYPDLNDEEE
jgi:hypothetical protein